LAEQFLKLNIDDESEAVQKYNNWHNNVKLLFLNHILQNIERVSEDVYQKLNALLKYNNADTKTIWNVLSLKTKHNAVIPEVKEFLATHGRMKYIKPIYFAWIDYQKDEAKEYFEKHRHLYADCASRMIEKKLI
jgi:leukotriene-A4 hydrolase